MAGKHSPERVIPCAAALVDTSGAAAQIPIRQYEPLKKNLDLV